MALKPKLIISVTIFHYNKVQNKKTGNKLTFDLTQLLQLKKCFIVYQLFSQGGLSYCVLQIFIFLNGIFLYFRMS